MRSRWHSSPLHYLPLLERRPGAWDHAKPIQEWRESWPEVYDRYLAALQERLSTSQATREFVRILRLPTVAANYARFAQEASQSGQRYEEYLLALLNEEVNQRDINRRKRLVGEARFPVLRTLDEFDFSVIPRYENIALIGGIGTGKTHVAISLGLAACEQGHKVRFYTAAGLTNELLEAQESHGISKLEARLMKCKLIILDEVGFIPFSQKGAQMLFGFISQRYQRGSLIVTSNLGFAEWTEVFGDPRLTSALLDRLTHRCHILEFTGKSYRFRQSLQQRGGI